MPYKFFILLASLMFFRALAPAQTVVLAPGAGGSPVVLASSGILNATTAFSPTTSLILPGSATASHDPTMIELVARIYCTQASSGTVQVEFNYTDIGGTAQVAASSTANCATLGTGSTSYVVIPVMIQAGTPIYGGVILTGAATYSAGLVVLQQLL